MFQLTRQIRFTLTREDAPDARALNGHGGAPAIDRLAPWMSLDITLVGELSSASNYLCDIRNIDAPVRRRALPRLIELYENRAAAVRLAELPGELATALTGAWPDALLHAIKLNLSPCTAVGCVLSELPMVRFSHTFEFSAAHRLHNPKLSDAENRKLFGKCNNQFGHGHNYELQVTLAGTPDANGVLIPTHRLEQIVDAAVIQKFDHKHLTDEVAEFAVLIASVENIAKVSFELLKQPLLEAGARLASVTVWETPKTWCEYSETTGG